MRSPRSRAHTAFRTCLGDSGVSRPGIYKALGEDENPSFGTIRSILSAMGLRLTV
jgi:DNA-binding phage protein